MKSAILEIIRSELLAQFERLSQAACEAHAATTDPGSKAESKYDTRNLEASYLASGQARQVDELAEAVRIFDALVLPNYAADAPIDVGALVEVSSHGESLHFLLVPISGGLEISYRAMEITLLSPASDLYRKLLGMRVGESLDGSPLRIVGLT